MTMKISDYDYTHKVPDKSFLRFETSFSFIQ